MKYILKNICQALWSLLTKLLGRNTKHIYSLYIIVAQKWRSIVAKKIIRKFTFETFQRSIVFNLIWDIVPDVVTLVFKIDS